MDPTVANGINWNDIVQMIGPGPVAVLLAIAWKALPMWKADIESRQEANKLKRFGIKLKLANAKFLKEQGYEIDIPDITEAI